MSRKKTPEELDMEAERAQEDAYRRANCPHFNCHPIEWYWSGAIQTMVCDDCGEREWRPDPNEL